MQDIDNDMDDLFRRAAEKYPLHPGQSNWDIIEKKLSSAAAPEDTPKPGRKNNYKKLLLLFLLTGISLVIGFIILNLNSKNYKVAQNENQINLQANTKNNSVAKDNLINNKLPGKSLKINERISKDEKRGMAQLNISSVKNKIPGIHILNTGNKNNFSKRTPSKILFDNYSKNNITNYQKRNSQETVNVVNNPGTKSELLLPKNNKENNEFKNKPVDNINILTPTKKKLKPNSKTLKEKRFYAGIIEGPDFSKVKASSFKGPGLGAGILIGYKINQSFFAETGISYDTKSYSSDGNNFYEKGASMPDGMVINNLTGRSKILEIPIKIGYRFYQNKKINLFAAGGVSTYIMTNEKNNYNVTMNGNSEKMEGNYKKSSVKIPAVFNFSVAMEKQLSDLLKIRLEPYLKLPLQGVGVGKLPVTSAGIQIGLVGRIK